MSSELDEYPDDLNPFGDDEEQEPKVPEGRAIGDECTTQTTAAVSGSEPEGQIVDKAPLRARSARGSVVKAEVTPAIVPADGSASDTEDDRKGDAHVVESHKTSSEGYSGAETKDATAEENPVSLNPFGEEEDDGTGNEEASPDALTPSETDVEQIEKIRSSSHTTPGKATPFDPPPRPPPPKIIAKPTPPVKRDPSYDDALNPFAEDDDEEKVASTSSKPPAPPRTSLKPETSSAGSSPRRYKKKAPAPPPPTVSGVFRNSHQSILALSDDDRPRSLSRLSNASLDSVGAGSLGTPHRKKKPAPNAPIPPKRVFAEGFVEKRRIDLNDVDVKIKQLRRQQETIKKELAFFGIDDSDLNERDGPAQSGEEQKVDPAEQKEEEQKVDPAEQKEEEQKLNPVEQETEEQKSGPLELEKEDQELPQVNEERVSAKDEKSEDVESDYEARVDQVLEDGSACDDTGSEISKVSSGGGGDPVAPKAEPEDDNVDEEDGRATERVVEKLTLLAEIGEELEELMWRRKEIVFDLDDYDLNKEHAELEHRIRVIQAKQAHLKSPEEREEENELIDRLMTVVNRRDALVEEMDAERKQRGALVLDSTSLHASSSAIASNGGAQAAANGDVAKQKSHKKYKIPKLKSKTLKKIKEKMQHHKGGDADGDSKRRSSKKS